MRFVAMPFELKAGISSDVVRQVEYWFSHLKWVATLIALPVTRMRFGVLLISEEQGTGKGTLIHILRHLAGSHNTSIPSEKQLIDGKFTSFLVRKRFVGVHEIYAGQAKKAYDSLKSYVTDDMLDVEEKFLKPYAIANWAHFLLCSNSLLALRLVKGDRRWFVPKVTEVKLPPSYWTDFYAWLVEGGLEEIHQWACEFVMDRCFTTADEAPMSEAKEELIERSRSEGQQLAYNLGKAAVTVSSNGGEEAINWEEVPIKPNGAVVFIDQFVRDWIMNCRGLTPQHSDLESQLTIRKELKGAGMKEIVRYIVHGRPCSAWGNQAAMEEVHRGLNGLEEGKRREELIRRTRLLAADPVGFWKKHGEEHY
jgi:hypothetical protein